MSLICFTHFLSIYIYIYIYIYVCIFTTVSRKWKFCCHSTCIPLLPLLDTYFPLYEIEIVKLGSSEEKRHIQLTYASLLCFWKSYYLHSQDFLSINKKLDNLAKKFGRKTSNFSFFLSICYICCILTYLENIWIYLKD